MKGPKVKYTLSLKRKILDLLEKYPNYKPKDIAKELDIPLMQINAVMNYFNIYFLKYRELQIINDYKCGYTYLELMKKYNYSKTTIYRILKKNNLTTKRKKRRFKNIEKKLEEFDYKITNLAKYYNADIKTIINYLKKKNLYSLIKEKRKKRSKNVKKRFFEFMNGKPLPKKNRKDFYKKVADLLECSPETIRKVSYLYLKNLEKQN